MSQGRAPLILLVVSALLFAACNEATSDSAEEPTAPPTSAASPATTPAASTTSSTGPTVTRDTRTAPTSRTTVDEPPSTSVPELDEQGCPVPLADGSSLRLTGDLDGDGGPETITVDRPPPGETTIRVCASDLDVAPYRVVDPNKPAEVYLIDVEGDGAVELLVGGPTGSAIFTGSIVRLHDAELRDLRISVSVMTAGASGSSFGCVDVDDDGLRELVALTYEFDADTVTAATSVLWTRTVVLDDDASNEPVATGTFDTAARPDAVRALVNGTCGEDTIFEVFARP